MRPVGRAYKSGGWSGKDSIHFAVSVVVIGLVAAFFIYVFRPTVPLEITEAGCRVGQAPTSQTIVLVDNTDPFSPAQIARVRKALDDAHNKVTPWGMLTIASIGGELPPVSLFARCSPEKGETFGWWESIRRSNENWLELKQQYEEQFQKPVQNLITHMPLNRTTPHSPIIASIDSIVEELDSGGGAGGSKRKVIIFSDLMENTPAFSQYGSLKTFAQARASVPYIRDLDLNLHNTGVTVYYLTGRPGNVPFQGKRHERFWKDLIACYGGHVDEWVPLPMH